MTTTLENLGSAEMIKAGKNLTRTRGRALEHRIRRIKACADLLVCIHKFPLRPALYQQLKNTTPTK